MKIEEIKILAKKVFKSKIFKIVLYVLGFIVVASFIFKAGMFAGFQKASFGKSWGDNYSKNFGMMSRGPRGMMENFDNFPNPHGAIGKVIRNEANSIVVSDGKDKVEKVIIINDSTEIRKGKIDVSKEDLIADTFVIVIGGPNNDGQIEAKLIRIMPSPENMGLIGDKFIK